MKKNTQLKTKLLFIKKTTPSVEMPMLLMNKTLPIK